MDNNTLTVAELKRRGMAAIEDGLKRGPIRIIKRNKAAAVVMSTADYERLAAAGGEKPPGMSAMQWLLAQPARGRSSKRELDRRLDQERDW
ncbi:MAG TPA: hypothetical protein PLI44_05855 [Chiayiivirga sp.]|nr:hypothetical protein [Chiayiivirga sp.]HRP71896.1 hypothetical protein [Luteimonas sp.]